MKNEMKAQAMDRAGESPDFPRTSYTCNKCGDCRTKPCERADCPIPPPNSQAAMGCTCGQPGTEGVLHRSNGPCYVNETAPMPTGAMQEMADAGITIGYAGHAPVSPRTEPASAAVAPSYWLIESTMGCGWWDGRVTNRGIDARFFSTDPNEAVRFARKEDAERITQGSSFIKATEHIWIDSAQAAPQGQQSAGAGDVLDPCPQCAPGGVCKTPKCGRLASPELMAKFGIFDAAAKADPAQEADTHKCPRDTPYGPATCGKCFEAELAQEADDDLNGQELHEILADMANAVLRDASQYGHHRVRLLAHIRALKTAPAQPAVDLVAAISNVRKRMGNNIVDIYGEGDVFFYKASDIDALVAAHLKGTP